MIRAYVPERPSMWRDLCALDLRDWRTGLPVIAGLALVFVFSLFLECLA